jgi:hypothetical protein
MAKSKDMIDPLVVVWKTSERSNAKYKLKAFKGYHIDYFLKTDSKLPGLPEDAIILEALGNNNPDLARDLFDFGIMCVANYRILDGIEVHGKVENVKLSVWLERYWYGLENNNLLL